MDSYRDDLLMHYGVPGMRWGVRRYQNADGSLTAKGKKRYASVETKYKAAQREQKSIDETNKRRGTLINKDGRALMDRFNRAQYTLEKAYASNPNSQAAVKARQTLKDMKKMVSKSSSRSSAGMAIKGAYFFTGIMGGLPAQIFIASHPAGRRFAANSIVNELGGRRYEQYENKIKEFEAVAKEVSKKKG